VTDHDSLDRAAQLFRALGNESRLKLISTLHAGPHTVSQLTATTGSSQPLVSQHLKLLREVGIVIATRHGRESYYEIADAHIANIVSDAVEHVSEASNHPPNTTEEES